MLRYATGVDLITNAVRAAVGEVVVDVEQKPYNGHWAEVMFHADQNGHFEGIDINDDLKKCARGGFVGKQNDKVSSFHGANDAIGTLLLSFPTAFELNEKLKLLKQMLEIHVRL